MPGSETGRNLFMCIPPDCMRDDLPSTLTPHDVACNAYMHGAHQELMYVGITDDMGNTVTLPCFDVRYVDGKVVVMAHRTGRPIQ